MFTDTISGVNPTRYLLGLEQSFQGDQKSNICCRLFVTAHFVNNTARINKAKADAGRGRA